MTRTLNLGAIAAALTVSALSIGSAIAPTPAGATTAYYTAELAAPAAKPTTVAGGVVWSCKGTTCVAAKGNSRPARVCRELQRETGVLAAFTVKDEAIAADDLARCND